MYLLALDAREVPARLTSVRELTPEEIAWFRAGVLQLAEFEAAGDLLPLIEANERAAAGVVAGVLGAPLAVLNDRSFRASQALEVNRALLNYLASLRLYLDHTQARLTRRYGADGGPTRAFKAATADAFDGTAAYRVLSKLRNYMQHVGMPVRQLAFTTYAVGGPGGPPGHTVAVGCDRQAMLDQYDGWGKARADLAAMPDSIEIPPLLAAGSAAVRGIEARLLAAEAPVLRGVAERLVALLREVGPGLRATVAEIQPEGATTYLSCLIPPFGVLDLLGVSSDVVAAL